MWMTSLSQFPLLIHPTRKVQNSRLGGPRAGYSPVVIQQVGDSHQVVGEHGGAHQEFEMRASFEVASLHPAAAEQHRDAALNAGAESLSLLELFTALQCVLLGRLVTSALRDRHLGYAGLFGVLYILGAEEAAIGRVQIRRDAEGL